MTSNDGLDRQVQSCHLLSSLFELSTVVVSSYPERHLAELKIDNHANTPILLITTISPVHYWFAPPCWLCCNSFFWFYLSIFNSHNKMGWTYNTVPNADTNAPIIAAVGITFCTLSLITVCLRMYVRGILIKAIGPGRFLARHCFWERKREKECSLPDIEQMTGLLLLLGLVPKTKYSIFAANYLTFKTQFLCFGFMVVTIFRK